MKNIDIFKTFFHKKEIEEVEHKRREQLIDSIFANTIYSSQKPMNTKKQFKLLFIRRHFSTSIAFALFFIAILSMFGFMQVSKEKIGTVSAKELVARVEKAYGNKFYYKKTMTFDCQLEQFNASIQEVQSRGGQPSALMIKERDACAANNGKLSRIEKVWVDKTQNATKIETVLNPWDIEDGVISQFSDEYGRGHMQVKQPIQMQKDRKIYQFVVVTAKTNSKNLMEGVFIEKVRDDIASRSTKENFEAVSKNGKDRFSETLEYYKNAKDAKLEVEEFQQNGKQYYKLKTFFKKGWYDPQAKKHVKVNEWYVSDEQIFEKETYKPIKYTSYFYDDKYTKKTIDNEFVYEDFSAEFNDAVFDINQPPEGYAFAEGTLKEFEINYNCSQCVFGDNINYVFKPQTYLNAEGNTVDYSFDVGFWNMNGNGKVVNFPDVKIYESKERFATEYEAQNAAQIDFQQLKNVDKSTKFLQGFQFESNITLGEEKPFSIIKVVTTNQNNEKVELNKVTKLPYKATKLPEQGKLKFQYVRTEREKEIAYYKWNEGSAMNIQVYLNGSPDDYEATMCQHEVYIRDGQGKNVCKKNRDTQIEEERALFEYDFKGEKVVVWPQSIIRSGDLTAFVRFNTAEAIDSCILENKNNSTPFSCFDQLHSIETKEEVVKEMKELLKKIEKGS